MEAPSPIVNPLVPNYGYSHREIEYLYLSIGAKGLKSLVFPSWELNQTILIQKGNAVPLDHRDVVTGRYYSGEKH